jgi:hypothetical protein
MGFFFLYYALGLPTFLTIIIALYLLFTGTNSSHMSLLLKDLQTLFLAELVLYFVLCPQARERHSTSASSSKRQVHTCGHRRASVSV